MPIPQAHNQSKTDIKDKNEWRTPLELFNGIRDEFLNGKDFDVDLAASHENRLVLSYMEDAFICNWSNWGNTGFCNPPFEFRVDFIKKAQAEMENSFRTLMILPYAPETDWWIDNLMFEQALELYLPRHPTYILSPRVQYLAPDGKRMEYVNKQGKTVKSSVPFVSAVVDFNPWEKFPNTVTWRWK